MRRWADDPAIRVVCIAEQAVQAVVNAEQVGDALVDVGFECAAIAVEPVAYGARGAADELRDLLPLQMPTVRDALEGFEGDRAWDCRGISGYCEH